MKTKLEQFIIRNRKRNAHLYDDTLINGQDYIICPVSNERLSMIKSSYITNILKMTVEEYDLLYPGIRGVSLARIHNIKTGLKQIDNSTGLTKYELSQVKAREKLSKIDDNGVSGYKKKGQKTRQTHMNNIDEYGRNGYSQIASKAIIKGNITKSTNGLILDASVRNEFYRYKAIVTYLTEKHRKHISVGYITGLAGEDGAYHIDHKFSIMQGYKNRISPLVIGNIKNLSMIPWEENLSKHTASSLDIIELLKLTGYTQEQSLKEFDIIINFIKNDMNNNMPVSGIRILEKLYETTLC